jgi:pyruvate/2-oxoacid:ferredoxin oxidoreductase alpha subunit
MITKRMPLPTNYAVAYAAKACDVDVVAAYPITPQSDVVERIAQFVADGELRGEYIPVESEHSAMSACIGASLTGARTFTATCSQGLALMHECLFIASGLRLPIVMGVASRTLSAPLNIHVDYQDTMASRDCGWAQIYVSSAQEAYDSIIQGYKLGELDELMLPVMVCYDGYVLSHTHEAVLIHHDEDVQAFIPKKMREFTLNPDKPIAMGVFCMPDYTYEFKYQLVDALEKVPNHLRKVDEEFGKRFGRSYGLYEIYRIKDADFVMVTMGAIASTAKVAVDELRREGKKVGLFRPRLFRPPPIQKWREILSKAKVLVVVDRAIGFGSTVGPLLSEILGVFMNEKNRPLFSNYVAGIGGRDVTVADLKNMFNKTIDAYKENKVGKVCEYYGVRG